MGADSILLHQNLHAGASAVAQQVNPLPVISISHIGTG